MDWGIDLRNRYTLQRILRNHFILFTFALLFLVFIVMMVMNGIGEGLVNKIDLLNGENNYRIFAENFEEEKLQAASYGGKIQVLDENYNIVLPKEEEGNYSSEEIYQLNHGEYSIENTLYSGILSKLESEEGVYYKLLILPQEMLSVDYTLNMDLNRETGNILLLFLTAAVIMITGYWIILKLSTRRIDRLVNSPLLDLRDDMKKVEEEKYEIEHNCYEIEEFDEMRISFETMAKQLSLLSEKTKSDEFLRYRLISELGHDIKNSITPIKGYASILLMEEGLKNKYKIPIEKIVENCNDMEKMLQILMTFGKLSRVDYELNLKTIDIVDLFRSIIAEKYSSFEMKEIEQIIEIEEKEILIEADDFELKRAIINLVDNASTHNIIGGKAYMAIEEGEQYVRIIIADDGRKIDESLVQLIFEPFIRKSPTKDKMGHSGLGLSISKRIVEKHHGEIYIEQPFRNYSKAFILKLPKKVKS